MFDYVLTISRFFGTLEGNVNVPALVGQANTQCEELNTLQNGSVDEKIINFGCISSADG